MHMGPNEYRVIHNAIYAGKGSINIRLMKNIKNISNRIVQCVHSAWNARTFHSFSGNFSLFLDTSFNVFNGNVHQGNILQR